MSAEPNKITATVQEAEALQAKGNTQGAIQLYRQWLKHSNSQYDWLIQFNLGILLRDGGDTTGAQQAFQTVLKQNPDFVQARAALEQVANAEIQHRTIEYKQLHSDCKNSRAKTFLHIGCGPKRKNMTTRGFNKDIWKELRFDIDASVQPDLIGTMTDMSAVTSESVDAIFSSHNIEHLYPHEMSLAFKEFLRVLKPNGFFVATCPDLKSVCALVAEDKLLDTAYISPAGPIAPIDILYGHRPPMASGNLFMAHHSGFTQKVLDSTLRTSGFATVISLARPSSFDLWVVASKSALSDEAMHALAMEHFPV